VSLYFPRPRINQQKLAAALGERFNVPADRITGFDVANHGGRASEVTLTLFYVMPEHEITAIVNQCIETP
jgi:hypothetical protein